MPIFMFRAELWQGLLAFLAFTQVVTRTIALSSIHHSINLNFISV